MPAKAEIVMEDDTFAPRKKTKSRNKRAHSVPIKEINKLNKMMSLYIKGLGAEDIAKALGLSKAVVTKRLEPFHKLLGELHPSNVEESLELYAKKRKMLFEAAELRTLQSLMCPEKHAKATLNQAAYAFQQIFNARRLEDNKSTHNINGLFGVVDSDKYKQG